MARLVLFLLFVTVGTGLFYLVFVHEVSHEADLEPLPAPSSDVTLNTVHIRQLRGVTLEWELFADTAVYNESSRQALLTAVRMRVYQSGDEDPQPVDVRGVAGRALLDEPRQRVLLQDQVKLTKDDEVEMRGDLVDYLMKDGFLKARGNVFLRQKDAFILGDTLDYNIAAEKAVVGVPTLYQ